MEKPDLDPRLAALVGKRVRGVAILGDDYDVPSDPIVLTGVLQGRYVPGLDYVRFAINGAAIDPETIEALGEES